MAQALETQAYEEDAFNPEMQLLRDSPAPSVPLSLLECRMLVRTALIPV